MYWARIVSGNCRAGNRWTNNCISILCNKERRNCKEQSFISKITLLLVGILSSKLRIKTYTLLLLLYMLDIVFAIWLLASYCHVNSVEPRVVYITELFNCAVEVIKFI